LYFLSRRPMLNNHQLLACPMLHDHRGPPSLCQTVIPAAPASHDAALPTLIDVSRKGIVAFLALMATGAGSPNSVLALVIRKEILPLTLDKIGAAVGAELMGSPVPVDNNVCTSKKPPLFPLWAPASPPAPSTHIAELSVAAASWAPRSQH
jgi:hypothetical protein